MRRIGERPHPRATKTRLRPSWSGEGESVQGGRCGIQSLGESIHELPQGTKVLAVPIAEVDQAEAGKRERIRLPPQAFVVCDGERVGAGHLGAV